MAAPLGLLLQYLQECGPGSPGPAAVKRAADLYELNLNRHRASSCVSTSNRAVDEWLSLFHAPILGNSALDRLAPERCWDQGGGAD